VTGRAAALQGGLAALGLITAHFTWQREPERAPGEVIVIDASKNDVAKIHFEDEKNRADFARGTRDGDAVVWVHMESKPPAAGKDKEKDKKAPPKPAFPPRDLLGADSATKLYERFSPLVSPRAFGVLDAAKLKELGLDSPTRKLTVTVKGDTRAFEIGKPAGAVSGESFLRDTRDGRVYLMPRGLLSDLQNANHLVDRKLHAFEPADYDRIVITAGGKKKELLHLGKEMPANEGFAPLKTPDKRDQMAKNWHDTIWRTFPLDTLGKGEPIEGGTPKVAVRIDYYDGKKPVGWLELARVEPPAPKDNASEEPPPAPLNVFYARSEHTVGWAKLGPNGSQLIADAEKLTAQP
jgi:hypothetical protein